jgi:hypothetical protein
MLFLATPLLFPPFLYHAYTLFPHTPAVALTAKEQGRQAGFTSREKKQWKGSPYEWRYQYSIALSSSILSILFEYFNKNAENTK